MSLVTLTKRLRRITAPNPGPMTGEGTNCYLIGQDDIAVVDPGPAIDSHINHIVEIAGDRIKWIIVTHTHRDHSPAAAKLAEITGAPCLGMLASDPSMQDSSFVPDVVLAHDDTIASSDFTLRTIHTPGHVDNHLCFLLEEDGILLAGDHIMNGSTVVIVPPQGDMKAYIESLQRLKDYSLKAIAPGHGELIENPMDVLDWTVKHRLIREEKVLSKLTSQPALLSELVTLVYDDVSPTLHPIAEYSLWAHLLKLEKDKKAIGSNDNNGVTRWSLLLS